MYKAQIRIENTTEGQSIEERVRRDSELHAEVEQISPMIYTEAKNGVMPQYDIRTDRQEIALDAIDHYTASEQAKSDNWNIEDDRDIAGYVEPSKDEEQ